MGANGKWQELIFINNSETYFFVIADSPRQKMFLELVKIQKRWSDRYYFQLARLRNWMDKKDTQFA